MKTVTQCPCLKVNCNGSLFSKCSFELQNHQIPQTPLTPDILYFFRYKSGNTLALWFDQRFPLAKKGFKRAMFNGVINTQQAGKNY